LLALAEKEKDPEMDDLKAQYEEEVLE